MFSSCEHLTVNSVVDFIFIFLNTGNNPVNKKAAKGGGKQHLAETTVASLQLSQHIRKWMVLSCYNCM